MEHPLLNFDFAVCRTKSVILKKNQVESTRAFFFFFYWILWWFAALGFFRRICLLYINNLLWWQGKQMSPMMIVVCMAIRLVLKSPAALVGKRNSCRWCSMCWVSGRARLRGLTGGDRCDQHWVRSSKNSWMSWFFNTVQTFTTWWPQCSHSLCGVSKREAMCDSYCCNCHLHSKHCRSLHPQC